MPARYTDEDFSGSEASLANLLRCLFFLDNDELCVILAISMLGGAI